MHKRPRKVCLNHRDEKEKASSNQQRKCRTYSIYILPSFLACVFIVGVCNKQLENGLCISYRSSYNYKIQKMTFNRKQMPFKTFCFAEEKVPDSPDSCPRGLLEQALCHRLCTVVAALHELSQSALPDGPCTEATLKVTKKWHLKFYSIVLLVFRGSMGKVQPWYDQIQKGDCCWRHLLYMPLCHTTLFSEGIMVDTTWPQTFMTFWNVVNVEVCDFGKIYWLTKTVNFWLAKAMWLTLYKIGGFFKVGIKQKKC